MSARKLPAAIEQLVAQALGPVADGETHSTFKLAALAKALTEAGIDSKVATCTVAFDPERWTRPEVIEALKIKTCTTDGMGAYGWDALIEKERVRLGFDGDYVDKQGHNLSTWDDIFTINQANFGERMQEELDQMRAFVQQWTLDQQTPSTRPTPRRPGL
jgi:hypothetical protein